VVVVTVELVVEVAVVVELDEVTVEAVVDEDIVDVVEVEL